MRERTFSRTRHSDVQVSAVRASPDGLALALQRTPAFLEVVDTGSGSMLVASPARRGAPLVGFFWTAAPGADLVMATAAGLELYTLAPGGQARLLSCCQRAARFISKLLGHVDTLILGPPCGHRHPIIAVCLWKELSVFKTWQKLLPKEP